MPITSRPTALLLNVAHALDHLFLLIFATAIGAIAVDLGFERWEDLMPYGAGAFVLFGLGSLPAGRLGDLWGRRRMMLVFFFGLGAAALLVACARGAWELAAALTLMGAFASVYHPVGIPMLVQGAARPGTTIGINGLAGNLGVAAAAGCAWGRDDGATFGLTEVVFLTHTFSPRRGWPSSRRSDESDLRERYELRPEFDPEHPC